jgi:hypothetical protein
MRSFLWIIFLYFSPYVPLLSQNNGRLVECMDEIAISLIGSPYVEHTLDNLKEERLIYHADKFDCVTLVEYVFALAIYYHQNQGKSFEDILTQLRYKNGKINGYSSRIHYITEWLHQASSLGLVEYVKSPHTRPRHKELTFMSSHKNLYSKAKATDWTVIRQSEKYLSSLELPHMKKSDVIRSYDIFSHMDIVAISTSTAGLDFSHIGLIFMKNKIPYILHASKLEKKVVVSSLPLDKYLEKHPNQTGIVIARPRL